MSVVFFLNFDDKHNCVISLSWIASDSACWARLSLGLGWAVLCIVHLKTRE